MSPWFGLLKKEYRLSRTGILIGLIFLIVLLLSIFSFGPKGNTALFVLTSVLLMLHSFYLSIYMFFSLKTEGGHLHLWLHNTHSAKALLLAKLINGIVGLIISFAINYVFVILAINKLNYLSSNLINTLLLLSGNIIGYSIYLAMWIVFIWVVFQVSKGKIGSYFSWFISVGAIIIPTWLLGKFRETSIFKHLTNWGYIDISEFGHFVKELFVDNPNVIVESDSFKIGVLLFYFLLTILLFLISSWLIDEKVEV